MISDNKRTEIAINHMVRISFVFLLVGVCCGLSLARAILICHNINAAVTIDHILLSVIPIQVALSIYMHFRFKRIRSVFESNDS